LAFVSGFSNPLISTRFDQATGTFTLTGTDTKQNYQTALRNVTYVNNSDNPSGATRIVTFTVLDGSPTNGSGSATRAIAVTPVNDPPQFTDQGNVPSSTPILEDSGSQVITAWAQD